MMEAGLNWENIDEGPMNPLTDKVFSSKYQEILEKRKQLPVFQLRGKIVDLVSRNQFVVLVGETGSGKTTQ